MPSTLRLRFSSRLRGLLLAGLCCLLLHAGLGWRPQAAAARSLTASCTGAALATSPASPQPTGEQITLTGSASGCTDPSPLFKYWVQPPTGSALLIQDWTTGTATWNSTGLTPGSYTLTLWAKDASSLTSTYDVSATSSFNLSVATAPGTVTLSNPANAATNTGTTPTFTWTAPSGATTGTTTYTVTLWDPFSGSGGTKIGDFSAGTSTSYTLRSGTLASGKSYEWNVSACNDQACSGYGSWWQFSTSASAHTAQQSTPANGATGQTLTPTLSWC